MAEYIIQKKSLVELADILREKQNFTEAVYNLIIGNKNSVRLTSLPEGITSIGNHAFCDCFNLALTSLPEGITSIGDYAFSYCSNLAITSLPEGITSIGSYAFSNCSDLATLTFKSTPTSIAYIAFFRCDNLTTINVPWAEGAVAGAPWGARNATINYNYTGG